MASTIDSLSRRRVQIDTLNGRDGSPTWFSAWTQEGDWNGWAIPFFEFGEAMRLADAFNDRQAEEGRGCHASYDEAGDAFVFVDDDLPDEPERFHGIQIGDRKLYGIGAAAWTWSGEA